MNECFRIADQLKRAFEGEAWHGPALLEILADVDAMTAMARAVPGAHTIWELTLHIAVWEKIVLRRMGGEAVEPSDEENFPVTTDQSQSAWERALLQLRENHAALLKAMSSMPESRLSEQVPGKDHNFYVTLHGTVQHAIYHAGQIALLKKAIAQR